MNITEKHRPKEFSEVLGQSQVTKSLEKIIADRSHSTFLLEGPSGVGKTTLARICARLLGASGLDVEEFDAATNSGVEDMRSLAERQMSFPMSGSRVFIIDECQRLSKNAWDALLKSTEAPPKNNYWFFCTTEISKVPKTIRTRSMEFKLKPVSSSALEIWLQTIRDEEDLEVPDELIADISRSVEGSPRSALLRLKQADRLSQEDLASLLEVGQGIPGGYDLAKLLSSKDFDVKEVVEVLKELKGEDPEGVRQVVRAYFTTCAMSAPSKRWFLCVLSEFEKPAITQNGITDIFLRVMRINKWKDSV